MLLGAFCAGVFNQSTKYLCSDGWLNKPIFVLHCRLCFL
ncbi:MAG: DUF3955 domain-containing protein [Snodgrassella sp.]|nr:DUF3955 domain-containing protein [Snodgrassella sp.]